MARTNWKRPSIPAVLVVFVLLALLPSCAPSTSAPSTASMETQAIGTSTPTIILLSTETVTPLPTLPENTSACLEPITPVSPPTKDFTEPDPGTWVMLMKPVQEYFYYRKKAVIAGNVQILWDRYPALKLGSENSRSFNAEPFFVEMMSVLKPFDGNIDPEGYGRIKVILSDGQAEVLVHGWELYLYLDHGTFEDSGGEFKIILFLCSQANQQWTVYQTDDVTPP